MVTRNQTTTNRFRSRKLSTKQNLAVLRESDLDASTHYDDPSSERQDDLNSLPKLETGVEQKEEKEHHLQAAITASHAAAVGGKVAQIYIPTPDAVPASGINYAELYPRRFSQPATYIRFSSTVEDSIGCPYCITYEDEAWLKLLNEKRRGARGAGPKLECSEDDFESIMQFFEGQSAQKQPFAAVDHTPVLAFPEMEAGFDETVEENARKYAKEIYEYWKVQRTNKENRSLMANLKTLKMDAGQEADDSDPYVCFRRREVRQVRKTRGRDAQITEKLRKLRKELEDARSLVDMVKSREHMRRKDLATSRQLFVQRASVREMKRKLTITGNEDDELLITQKTPKKRPVEQPSAMGRGPGIQLRVPNRFDGLSAEIQQILFSDKWEHQQRDISSRISDTMARHERWNNGFIDNTLDIASGGYPITPNEDPDESSFVKVKINYGQSQLATPPPSISGESSSEDEAQATMDRNTKVNVRWAKPFEEASFEGLPSFRLRQGRNGRLWLDRRRPNRAKSKMGSRWNFDHEDGDVEYRKDIDLLDRFSLQYRVHLKAKDDMHRQAREQEVQRRQAANADVAMTNGQTTSGS